MWFPIRTSKVYCNHQINLFSSSYIIYESRFNVGVVLMKDKYSRVFLIRIR